MKNRALFLLSLVCLPALAGCSADSDLGRTIGIIGGVAQSVVGIGGEDTPAPPMKVDRLKVTELPYASIGVEIADNPQFLFVLANQNATDDLYTLGYQVSIVLRNGRIIRTQGFQKDVLGGRWSGPDIITVAAQQPGIVYGDRYMETSEREVGTREAHCSAQAIGDESITILGAAMTTRHIQEHCEVADLKWVFDNDFWVDPASGQVWRSVQWIDRKAGTIAIEQFRPSSRPAS